MTTSSIRSTSTVKFAVATSATLIAKLTPHLLEAGLSIAHDIVDVSGVLQNICEHLDQQLSAINVSNVTAGVVRERCQQLRELVIYMFVFFLAIIY
jgi:hypothetical protein